MNAPTPNGPFATADALQTLKPLARAFAHVTEVRVCGHRVKARSGPYLWECVADSDNRRTPGCGALFAVTYPNGTPTWTPADTAEVTR
jgi:hypothetical protein